MGKALQVGLEIQASRFSQYICSSNEQKTSRRKVIPREGSETAGSLGTT